MDAAGLGYCNIENFMKIEDQKNAFPPNKFNICTSTFAGSTVAQRQNGTSVKERRMENKGCMLTPHASIVVRIFFVSNHEAQA